MTFSTSAFAETYKKLPYNFRYDLHLSDVACWITEQCTGIVEDNADGELLDLVERHMSTAKQTVDLAIYGIRAQDRLLGTMAAMRKSGVKFRATIDQVTGELNDWENSANFPYPDAIKLRRAIGWRYLKPDRNQDGSPRTGTIMHNKYYVVDNESVWLGSTNLSETGLSKEYNANSSIILYSKDVARLFTREFDQMYSEGLYSIYKRRHKLDQNFQFRDGTKVSVFFAPQDKPVDTAVVPFIDKAKKRIAIGIFYLTSRAVFNALIDAHDRGVRIKIVNDATAARHASSIVKPLRKAGIDVRVENWGGKMHMKTAVADGKNVLIGSMNWSDAGNTGNDESVIVIENQRQLASEIEDYIETLYDSLPSSTETRRYRDPYAESPDSVNSCHDGINNDHVGGTDMEVAACKR